MKAVLYRAPGDVVVTEVPKPSPAAGEVLIRVLSNTICGTDLRIATGIKKKGVIAPRILGHEVAGEIVGIGTGVLNLKIGDTVGLSPTYSCDECIECSRERPHLCKNASVLGHQADGGLAEFLLVPARPVSHGVLVRYQGAHDPVAISLAEPLSCIIHGQKFLDIGSDDVVLVIGGGAIGLMHAKLAKANGAKLVILSEPIAFRRALAFEFGADVVVDPVNENLDEIVRAHSDTEGAQVVVVCIGLPLLVNQALGLASNRGRVSLFAGFPADELAKIDSNLIHYKELSVFGSSNSTIPDYEQAIRMIDSGEIDTAKLVTHRFTLEEFEKGVSMITDPNALKIAIIPNKSHKEREKNARA
jgi:L-iditol 2-dehydrogenase